MSQHIQHHHPQQPQYVHYAGPSNPPAHPTYIQNASMIPGQPQHMHHILHYQPQQQQPSANGATSASVGPGGQGQVSHVQAAAQAQGVSSTNPAPATSGPILAQGDWTKDLVQLAKQAELKKHALALQLHTAHILSAHASLEQKARAIQDIKEQKNKLESERARLLKCLQEINSDRDQADLAEATLNKECDDLRTKITHLSEGEYAYAKTDVDRLRAELGQPPLPSLQQTLEERTAQYLTERRLHGNEVGTDAGGGRADTPGSAGEGEGQRRAGSSGAKRGAQGDGAGYGEQAVVKRPRGRPKGSKNKKAST